MDAVARRRVSDSRGPAFTRSGKGLDAMADGRLAYAPADDSAPAGLWIARGIVPLLDCIVGGWTAAESRAAAGALMGWTQERTARQWPANETTGRRPTRQAVCDSLKRAHWPAVESVLKTVEESI